MRILVLQLARFGDLYQTWPTLNALKRKFPEAELHVLVRERFQAGLDGGPAVTPLIWPTADILEPVLFSKPHDLDLAVAAIEDRLASLRAFGFDRIINLSFSPLSSFIVDALAGPPTEIYGYSRTSDGHLSLPDDLSAYFYAQVGVGRANRYHLTEIFAATAQVELAEDDFSVPGLKPGPRSGILIHLGASQTQKVYPAELWVQVLQDLSVVTDEPLYLIGSQEERNLSETVAAQAQCPRLQNLVGQTRLHELLKRVGQVKLLIGADSAPVHMASLHNTPTLCLSSPYVNFWETGPLAEGSRILLAPEMSELNPREIVSEAEAMLANKAAQGPCIQRVERLKPYALNKLTFDDFAWKLIEALYVGSAFPTTRDRTDLLGFQRLFELAELALEQIDQLHQPKTRESAQAILGQIDGLFSEVGKMSPRLRPLIEYFETQRTRIPPGSLPSILLMTKRAFSDLKTVSAVYRVHGSEVEELRLAVELCRTCAAEARECRFSVIQDQFQDLLSRLQDLARHSTKVAESSWSEVLAELNEALSRRDYVHFADVLQWKVMPALSSRLNEKETFSEDMIT